MAPTQVKTTMKKTNPKIGKARKAHSEKNKTETNICSAYKRPWAQSAAWGRNPD